MRKAALWVACVGSLVLVSAAYSEGQRMFIFIALALALGFVGGIAFLLPHHFFLDRWRRRRQYLSQSRR